jgi:OOP family OmpA-OmpF porin
VLPEELRSVSFIDTVKIDKRGIANPHVVDGKEERLNTRRTFTDKIVVTDSLRRTDTLFVPFIVITGDITAVGVDRNGNEQATAKLTIDMNTSNRVVSILPYIFFDEASATLPNRYKRISASDVATYDIDRLFFDSTLAIYHSILNVIGKRLILYPKATLTITGHNANTGSELGDTALSRQRARVIKSYLRDVWGVSANRLIIKAKNLPSAKSLPITEAVTAEENRRVELSSNDERILSPVSLNNTVTTSDPPSLRFKLSGAADLGLNTYKVEAGQQSNMENAFVSSGAFTGSKVVDWQVEADQRTAPRFDEPLHMSLTLSDKSGNEKLVDTDSMKLDVITVQRKMKENLDGFEVDRFNMILFDFNETEVSDLNKGIISKIQRRVKPGSITEIVGSTDSIGASAYNMRLSNERAQAVKMLIKRKGVTANGVGEEQLLFDNALPEGRFYCRTVSVTVKTPLK